MAVNGIGINHGDEYYTPKYVVDYFGEFDYDPATVKHKANEFGISNFDTIDTDGLKSDWTQYNRIWCNPPFTKKYDFIKKAVESYKSAHNDIYILIPIGSLTTKKFSETGFTGKIYIPNRRINFEHVNGIGKSPSMGSIIIKPESVDSIEYIDIKTIGGKPMTNYNERLDEILERLYRIAADTELAADRCDPYAFNGVSETKQAITSLIKELVEEAKPNRENKSYTNPIYNAAVYEFEQNLLKALEEL